MARDLKQVTATGDVVTGPVYLHSVSFAGEGTTPQVEVRDGSGGAVRLTLQAAAGGSASWVAGSKEGVLFSTSIHATLTGASSAASFEFS